MSDAVVQERASGAIMGAFVGGASGVGRHCSIKVVMTKRTSAANERRARSLAGRYSGERRLHQPTHPNWRYDS